MDKDDMIASAIFTIAIVVIVGIVGSLVFTMFGYGVVTIVGAGENGVKFDLISGGVQEDEFGEGFHLKAPWVKVDKFNMRTQDYTMSAVVEEGSIKRDDRIHTLTKEGMCIDLDITVLYKIVPGKADCIRQTIGTDGQYQEIVIRPTVRNAVRDIIVNYEAMDIYGDMRTVIENDMYELMQTQLAERNIIIEELLIRDVGLPAELSKAIEAKKTSEQESLRMEYILDIEKLEKERRIIEAEGISGANEIIAGSLTTEYLTWYWIDNLDTHNSVIYVPVGDAGLPLFREVTDDTPLIGEVV